MPRPWEFFITRQRHGRGYGVYYRQIPDRRKTDQWQLAYRSPGWTADPKRWVSEQEAWEFFCVALNNLRKTPM